MSGARVNQPQSGVLAGLLTLAVGYTLYFARDVLLPITLAGLIALLLSPAVKWLVNVGLPRQLAALVVVILFCGALGGVVYGIAEPAGKWIERIPDSIRRIDRHAGTLKRQIDEMGRTTDRVDKAVSELVEEKNADRIVIEQARPSWRKRLLQFAGRALAVILLTVTLLYFLLASGNRLVEKALAVRSTGDRRQWLSVFLRLERETARYLGVFTLMNLLVGAITTLYLWALGLPEPWLWGLVAALLRFIPYLGVLVSTVLIATASILSFDSLGYMVAAPLGFVVVATLVATLLEPLVHGYRLRLNPIVIFVSIFFFGWIWGGVGALLAVPLLTVAVVICRRFRSLKSIAEVMSA